MPLIHVFTDSGLGDAPFRFVRIWSAPSKILQERNPAAYQKAMRSVPKVVNAAHWQCQHCFKSLMNFFIIKDCNGVESVVGCDCAKHTGDAELISEIKAAERARQRELSKARSDAKREALRIEGEGVLAAEIKANCGVTDWERDLAITMDGQWNIINTFSKNNPEIIKLAHVLEDGNHGFRDSISKQILNGTVPVQDTRAFIITLEILAKQVGRKNSKAYTAEYSRVDSILRNVTQRDV